MKLKELLEVNDGNVSVYCYTNEDKTQDELIGEFENEYGHIANSDRPKKLIEDFFNWKVDNFFVNATQDNAIVIVISKGNN